MAQNERRLIRIVKALGLKPEHVRQGSVSLKPEGDGWLLEWGGVAFLSAEALSEISDLDIAASRSEREALAAIENRGKETHDGKETYDGVSGG